MLAGATGKRFCYALSSFFRMMSFIVLLIAYIAVKIVVRPEISWLNTLLLLLSISGLVSAVFNIVLCGFNAIQYKEKIVLQLICFLFTLCSGGIVGSTFTGIAVFTKVQKDDIKNEGIYNTRTFRNKDGKYDEETKG